MVVCSSPFRAVWPAAVVLVLVACSSGSQPAVPAAGSAAPPTGTLPSVAAGSGTPGAGATSSNAGAAAGRGGAPTVAGTSAAAAGNVATAGATAAPGGSAGAAGASNAGDSGDYFVSGTWRGYVWTSVGGMGTTITPVDFKMHTGGMPRCVKGSVAATTDYSGTASLGFNIAEDRATTGMMTVVPSKAGIAIAITNSGGSELRLQIHGPGASDVPWCAKIPASGGFVPWSSFNTKCWDGTGMAYNNEPIAKVSVLVPGATTAAVPFDFCVASLAEADGGSSAPAAGSGGSTAPAPGGAPGTPTPTAGSGGGTTTPVTPIEGGCDGYATGFWDCCKPHCSWSSNVPGGSSPLATCDRSDNNISDVDARSACEGGGTAHMCHSLIPWAVNDKLAYGFAAVAASDRDICGKCYELQFQGHSFNAGEDPGSAAIAGKTLIVQAINIGSDVANHQFDIAIPGRGVGMFDACTAQWGVNRADLGETYGGFLPACKTQHGRTDHAAIKACVMQSCMNVFEANGLTDLAAGCEWFVDWMEVADNPAVKFREVMCPAELGSKGVRRSGTPATSCR